MWTSTKFKTHKKQFDFSSSEQGKPVYTALKIDDVEFINMVEMIDGTIDENCGFQSIICDHCGFYKCASGNWMAIREFGDFVFFIPDFENIKEDTIGAEFDPPNYLKNKGTYYLTKDEFNILSTIVKEFAQIQNLKTLTNQELILLYKWDTPQKMFGQIDELNELRKERILVATDITNDEAVKIVESKIEELENTKTIRIEQLDQEKIISIYLDDHKTTEWKALCITGENYNLLLGGQFKIMNN
jgi:hypothetical protein